MYILVLFWFCYKLKEAYLPCLIIPPPPPLHAAVRSLVLLLHGFGTSTLSRSPPCCRGDVLYPGDPALVTVDCIAQAMGSRHFGWLPWFSWKPTLVVGDGGEMTATRPDGTRVRRTTWRLATISPPSPTTKVGFHVNHGSHPKWRDSIAPAMQSTGTRAGSLGWSTSPRKQGGERLRVDVPKPWSNNGSERTAACRGGGGGGGQ